MTVRLVGDIGGTNARFALRGPDGTISGERKLPGSDYPGLVEAVKAYLVGLPPVSDAVISIAGPVRGDLVSFTNKPWQFSIEAARRELGLDALHVINDFVAQAYAVPALGSGDVAMLKPGDRNPMRPIVVIGPGTGLGVALIVPSEGRLEILPSEAGHVSFSPQDDTEVAILAALRRQYGHVSTERLVSGPGLLAIARILAELDGQQLDVGGPLEVSERAAAGTCRYCAEAVTRFITMLGAAAGNLALTVLAEGGVFLTGGLCRNLGDLLNRDALVAGFIGKGRFRDYLEGIEIRQVTRPHSGLLGAACYGRSARVMEPG